MNKAIFAFVLIFIIVLFAAMKPKSDNSISSPPEPTKPKFSDEEMAALVAIASLKSAARDPDSVAIENFIVTDAASCVSYRARNGFGGMNRSKAVFNRDMKSAFNDTDAGFTRAWNRTCANKTGRDLTRFAQVNLSRLK